MVNDASQLDADQPDFVNDRMEPNDVKWCIISRSQIASERDKWVKYKQGVIGSGNDSVQATTDKIKWRGYWKARVPFSGASIQLDRLCCHPKIGNDHINCAHGKKVLF